MATKRIRLTRKWSGHEAGELIEEQDFTVDSMVRKGYGIIQPPKPARTDPQPETAAGKPRGGKGGRGPRVETTTAVPPAENAAATPQSEEK